MNDFEALKANISLIENKLSYSFKNSQLLILAFLHRSFMNENKGLVVAEVELEENWQEIQKPNWVGREVTGDPKYYNSNLIKNPFSEWPDSEKV